MWWLFYIGIYPPGATYRKGHPLAWLRDVYRLSKVKARKVNHATRRLGQRYEAYCTSQISFAQRDASGQGWINHVRFAYSWGLRRHLPARFP